MPAAAHYPLINCQSDRMTGQAGRTRPDRLSLVTRGVALARSVGRTLRLWGARIKERHAFPVLDERELRDLRMSRWQVEQELAKPFWRG